MPEQIGRYRVKSVVGAGGMSTVWLAEDSATGQRVAIKVLSETLARSLRARRRFFREGEIARSIEHPHVLTCRAVETGSDTGSERPYIVTDYMSGGSLQDLLDKQGPLATEQVLDFAKQIAAGLSAIHARGLIHADLKPSNILLDAAHQQVKISDFGLARVASGQHATFATLHYASPEQAQGFAIDHRSDLFSLGSVVYAMCAAQPPFSGESSVAVLRELTGRPAPPNQQLSPTIPDSLVAIIDKLMAKHPAARYQTADEVGVALESVTLLR